MSVVASGEVSPDEDHRRARRDPEQDTPGEVAPPERNLQRLDAFDEDDLADPVGRACLKVEPERHLHDIRRVGADEPQKERPKKEDRDRVHREGLDGPVDEEREPDGFDAPAGLDHFAEVDLDHDRIHHEKEAYRDRNGHDRRSVNGDRHAVQRPREFRGRLAQENASDDRKRHPHREVPFEEPQSPRRSRNAPVHHESPSPRSSHEMRRIHSYTTANSGAPQYTSRIAPMTFRTMGSSGFRTE